MTSSPDSLSKDIQSGLVATLVDPEKPPIRLLLGYKIVIPEDSEDLKKYPSFGTLFGARNLHVSNVAQRLTIAARNLSTESFMGGTVSVRLSGGNYSIGPIESRILPIPASGEGLAESINFVLLRGGVHWLYVTIKAGDGRPVLVLRSERGPAESEISYGVIAVDFEQALISDRLDQTFRDNYPDSP